MERSTRSKRNYYYDHQQDFDNETTMTRTRPRFNNSNNNNSNQQHYFPNNNNRYRSNSGSNFNSSNNNRQSKTHQQDNNNNLMVTTSYRILCHDMKAGGVIGKSGNIIKSIRQHTGAWINVHELIPGDEERIIEISDTRRRDPEGRMPAFSPAQEALFLIHDRILESDGQFGMNGGSGGGGGSGSGGGGGSGYGNEEDDYGGGRGMSNSSRVATRLVVSRMHVGCLLGKGGKIIEQMRIETKTQIRILPRDHTLPRCVSMSEEIVQVVGDVNAVKNAIAIISSRLRESQHRDRSHGNFHGRVHSPEQFFPDDDYIPHLNNGRRRSSIDGPSFGSRLSGPNYRSNNNSSWQSGYVVEAGSTMADSTQAFHSDDLVFRILCPADRVNKVMGESDGIVDLLQNDIGVDVKVSDPVSGSDEQIIIISSEEGPDDELFPAQEALLHIQTRIVDLVPDKDNIIKTKLIVSSNEIGCLKGGDGSLYEIERLTGSKLQILPREKLPACLSGTDELVQIEGEIKAARDALVELTLRLRSNLFKEFFQKDTPTPASVSSAGNAFGLEAASPSNITPARDGHSGGEPPAASYHTAQSAAPGQPSKDDGASSTERVKQNDSEPRKDVSSAATRISIPLVTRSILELVIPDHAVPKLVTKSKNKLAQISELSGANVTLVEDRPEVTEKIIQISGTPDQVERAQSLLQGFILSTQEDGP